MKKNNKKLKSLLDILFPLNRSIMGEGFRKSLQILTKNLNFKFIKFKTGTKVGDWKIPLEWNISDAFIKKPDGGKICDFKKNNLHVVGYSQPIKKRLDLKDLKKNIYFEKKIPNAIPYVTSYYKKRWGFCMKYDDYKKLQKGKYEVYIDSKFSHGELVIGEKLIRGKSKKEILFSTYLCHPSMANNELSGPLVINQLVNKIKNKKNLKFSYRFVITSETIGSIAYLKKRGAYLKRNLIAGYQVTCVGDNGILNYKKTKNEGSLSDFLAIKTLKNKKKRFNILDFKPTGSDERQYSSPGYDLPIGSLMRTPYDRYIQYHTSLDNKKFINIEKLLDTVSVYYEIIKLNEKNDFYISNFPYGEPMLGKRKLYGNLSAYNALNSELDTITNNIFWILSLSDGKKSYLEILEKSKSDQKTFDKSIKILVEKKLIKKIN